MVTEIDESKVKEIINQDKVLIDCYAPWCGPCKMLSPIIEETAKEVEDCSFYKMNVDDAADFAREHGIMSIPTLLLFEKGNLKDKTVGFKTKEEIITFINQN